ncbi:uncharacterized protein PAC_05063 [Phialocephala subalpina]|uniref:Tryptophan synthase beta chain-like PALP domain-containing protein n=1 Tax=Phialocephala subalpina TaxID=576137 RepID=A0A1L7WQW8_9HELO|nr:uncharacterized protein PAC_05063 [Phialocephala subalpina]
MRQVAAVAAKHGLKVPSSPLSKPQCLIKAERFKTLLKPQLRGHDAKIRKAHLLPNDHVSPDFPEYKTLGNVQIMHLLSATLSPHDSKADVEKVLSTLRSQGEIPYWIPSGASIHPLGGLGYARFAFELAHQENELGVFFDTIILPCAAGSTLAGIITGFKLIQKLTKDSADEEEEKGRRIIGIDVFANWPEQSRAQILSIARNTGSLIGLGDEDIRECDVVVDDRWNGGKYGVLNRETKDAVKMLAGLEGILTDPVYTGKAMAALIGKARKGEFEGSRNVLFVHTGGVPVLSAYPDLM